MEESGVNPDYGKLLITYFTKASIVICKGNSNKHHFVSSPLWTST